MNLVAQVKVISSMNLVNVILNVNVILHVISSMNLLNVILSMNLVNLMHAPRNLRESGAPMRAPAMSNCLTVLRLIPTAFHEWNSGRSLQDQSGRRWNVTT